MDNKSRQEQHQKNNALERLFPELERLLGNAEQTVLNKFNHPKFPLFLIIGAPRSGTTLVYQYLAQTNFFSYPTNLISRFYYAPYIGARIQQILIDLDLKGEIFNIEPTKPFASNLGKTFGPKQPHEFWYFWNRFFNFGQIQKLPEKNKKQVDWNSFNKELAAFESVYNKPILMKAMNFNWNLNFLEKNVPNVRFIYVKRKIEYNAQSLYMARKNFFGNINDWYSFKPPQYNKIKAYPPEKQVVEQVKANNYGIENQLEAIGSNKVTIIDYESFCSSPISFLKKISHNSQYQFDLDSVDQSIQFESGNTVKLDTETFEKIARFC